MEWTAAIVFVFRQFQIAAIKIPFVKGSILPTQEIRFKKFFLNGAKIAVTKIAKAWDDVFLGIEFLIDGY